MCVGARLHERCTKVPLEVVSALLSVKTKFSTHHISTGIVALVQTMSFDDRFPWVAEDRLCCQEAQGIKAQGINERHRVVMWDDHKHHMLEIAHDSSYPASADERTTTDIEV